MFTTNHGCIGFSIGGLGHHSKLRYAVNGKPNHNNSLGALIGLGHRLIAILHLHSDCVAGVLPNQISGLQGNLVGGRKFVCKAARSYVVEGSILSRRSLWLDRDRRPTIFARKAR